MNAFGGLLRRVVEALDLRAVPHMLTGSVAAAVHGRRRATLDVDLVIESERPALMAFCDDMLEAGFYVSHDAALEALAIRGMFNVLDGESGWKVDLIMRKDTAFGHTAFSRRFLVDVDGLSLYVATIEDLVIAKLDWARQGESALQLSDVAALVSGAGDEFDRAYVAHWVTALGLEREWTEATRDR